MDKALTPTEGVRRRLLAPRQVQETVQILQRAVDVFATGMAYFSGILFLLVAFYTTADVVGRRFGVFSGTTDEVSGYVLVVGAMCGLAFALRRGAHVRIDVLLPAMPPRLRLFMDVLALFSMGFFSFILALYSWRMALQSWEIKARALGLLGTPLYIPQFVMAFGLSLLTLEAGALLLTLMLERLVPKRDGSVPSTVERGE